jgi:hypothetical protein
MRHLPIKTTQKALDFSALAIAFVAHDGPRIALTVRQSRAQQQPAPRGPAKIFQFNPSPAATAQAPATPPAPSQPGAGLGSAPVSSPIEPVEVDVTAGDPNMGP